MANLRIALILLLLAVVIRVLYAPNDPPAPERQSVSAPISAQGPVTPPVPPAEVTFDIEKSTPVQTRDDALAAPLDEPASTVAWTSIRGKVGNAAGSPLEGIVIVAESHDTSDPGLGNSTAISDQRGEFTLHELRPGRQYSLMIAPQEDFAAYSLDSFVAGSAESLPDIVLERVELIDIDGMVIDTNHSPVADFEFAVRSLAAEFPDRMVQSDSTGYFKLESFPAGEIRIATNASDYFRIQGIDLRADEYRTLNLMIDRGSHHLGGWISDENGVPVAEAQVTLKSAFAQTGYQSFSYRSTVTDANGSFEFSGLGGHRVILSVYANGYRTHIEEHVFGSFSDNINVRLTSEEL